MVDQRMIHRLAAIGALVSAAAFIALVAVQPNRHPLPRAMWDQLWHSETEEWVVWAIIACLSLVLAFAIHRGAWLKSALLVSLIAVPTIYVAGHIAMQAASTGTHEYWRTLADFGVFRWLLAPWYAAHAATVFWASIGVWLTTFGNSVKR